jgi:hypothetical protein
VDGGPVASWIAGGGVFALLALTSAILFRSFQNEGRIADSQGRINDSQDERIIALRAEMLQMREAHQLEVTELRRRHNRCDHIVSVLILAMQQAGLAIPMEVFSADE